MGVYGQGLFAGILGIPGIFYLRFGWGYGNRGLGCRIILYCFWGIISLYFMVVVVGNNDVGTNLP